MVEIYKKLGRNIKIYRKKKNITSTEFAKSLSISTGQLSNIENGNYDVFKLELLFNISKSLDISIDELLEIHSFDTTRVFSEDTIKDILTLYVSNNSTESFELVYRHLNYIIMTYFSTISAYQWDANKIQFITDHIP